MPGYDTDRFEPPAPIAAVTLSDPATGARYEGIRMLIDTGADISVVPQSALNQLGLALTEPAQYEVTGFGEGHAALPAVELRMISPTSSKEHPDPVQGLDGLREVQGRIDLPIVAIGGITAATMGEVLAAGADAVAMVGEIVHAADVQAKVRELVAGQPS